MFQTFIVGILIEAAKFLFLSTYRQTATVVSKWVAEAEKMDGIDKRAFALENIRRELAEAGIQIFEGVKKDAMAGAKGYTINTINKLIEQAAERYR